MRAIIGTKKCTFEEKAEPAEHIGGRGKHPGRRTIPVFPVVEQLAEPEDALLLRLVQDLHHVVGADAQNRPHGRAHVLVYVLMLSLDFQPGDLKSEIREFSSG